MTVTHIDPVIDDVPLSAIRIDGGTQARTKIDETVVGDYAEAMRDGVVFPPVTLYFDGVDFWLADGFHRYHAALQAGREGLRADVRTGTLRDAKLHAAGANDGHGLRRTNADKRSAIAILLNDPEWVHWSDREIARTCHVSNHLVGDVRAALTGNSPTETPAERTYTTRHGTQATMKKVKASKAAPAPIPSNSGELEPAANDAEPTVATPRLTPEQGEVAVTEVEALRDEIAQLKADVAELLAENEHMARVFEADDQVKAALAEVARYKALAENAERTLAARTNEFNDRARNVVYWKNRAEKAEKLLGKVA